SCRLLTGRSRGSRQTEARVGKFANAAKLKLRTTNENRRAERCDQKAHDWISRRGSLGCVRLASPSSMPCGTASRGPYHPCAPITSRKIEAHALVLSWRHVSE